MKRSRAPRSRDSQSGEATLEFIVVAVGLLLPLALVVVGALTVQAAMTASDQAVREAGRAFMLAPSETEGRVRAEAAASIALADQGFDVPPGLVRIACRPCLAPDVPAVVTLDWAVPMDAVPLLGDAITVPIHARHVVVPDRYRSGEAP